MLMLTSESSIPVVFTIFNTKCCLGKYNANMFHMFEYIFQTDIQNVNKTENKEVTLVCLR